MIMQQPPDPYDQTTRQYAPPPPPVAPPPPMQPMPPQRPNALNRFLAWYRRQTRPMQVIVALGLIAAVIFVGSAAVSGIVQGSQQALEPTPTVASQPTPTSAPTRAPTPQPTLSTTQRITQLVHDNASNFSKIDMTQNDGKTVVVQITLNEALDKGSARAMIQENCFNVEKALWTARIASLNDVDLAFRGPAVDKFGNNSIAPYGVCDLTKATAAKFNWDNLSPPAAWDAYDSAQFYAIVQG